MTIRTRTSDDRFQRIIGDDWLDLTSGTRMVKTSDVKTHCSTHGVGIVVEQEQSEGRLSLVSLLLVGVLIGSIFGAGTVTYIHTRIDSVRLRLMEKSQVEWPLTGRVK